MRTMKVLFPALILLAGLASTATAQIWDGRGYAAVNFGGQAQDRTFTDSATFDIYGEQGAVAAGHSYGGGTLFDLSVGALVWENFGVGLAYTNITNKNDATVSIRVPHPILFGRSRDASATATGLKHSEKAVHLQLLWMLPLKEKIHVAFTLGPSFFSVRQQLATVRTPQDIRDAPPYTTVSIDTVTVTSVKSSPVGINIGVDGTYLVTEMIGVGLFARYAGASLNLPVAAGTRDGKLRVGGPQAGGGLRLRF